MQEETRSITIECNNCGGRSWFAQMVHKLSDINGLEENKMVLHCTSCPAERKDFDLAEDV